jgi:hypothetical protein
VSPDDDVDEEGSGRAIVTSEVRKQYVDDIFVDRDMIHRTIVFIIIEPCAAFSILAESGGRSL